MNKKTLYWIAGILAGLALLAALGGSVSVRTRNFGSTIGYLSSGGSVLTYNSFDSLLRDLNAVRAPLASMATNSASVNWGSLTSTSASTTIVNLSAGATVGDLCIVQIQATSTSAQFLGSRCDVTASGATNASATISVWSTSSTIVLNSATTSVWTLSRTSFAVPAALVSVTSTTIN